MRPNRLILFICIVLFNVPLIRASDSTSKLGVSDVDTILSSQLAARAKIDAMAKLETFLARLKKKQLGYKSEDDFVEYIFYFTHRKLLKKYDQYASLPETLTSGLYDCLTATTLYSILLNELSIKHEVVETNYHIYILVNPNTNKEILLETTDPYNGFLVDRGSIQEYKNEYRSNNLQSEIGQVDLNLNIERTIKNKELVGLLYYNQSVKEVNNRNWVIADQLARRASKYYPNIRISRLIEYIDTSNSSASL